MPLEVIILRDSGIPLFHYGTAGSKRLDELVAAFLSLVGHVIEKFSEEAIREIKFQESKFVWNKKGDLYFIAFVSAHDSSQVYDVILEQLAERFVSRYYEDLLDRKDDACDFENFTEVIERLLHRFDGVPGMARRYKTCLLPIEEMKRTKSALQNIESIPGVERSAYLTEDGFVIASNLRTYELEATLDIITSDTLSLEQIEQEEVIEHPSLDRPNCLLFYSTSNRVILTLVVNLDKAPNNLENILREKNEKIDNIDIEAGTKIEPQVQREPLEFDEHKMLVPLISLSEEEKLDQPLIAEVPSHMKEPVLEILRLADSKLTIAEIREKSGKSRKELDEIMAQIVSRGLARLSETYPNLTLDDSRFKAYLDVVGIPKRQQGLLDTIWHYLDGEHSISEIAEKATASPSRIVSVLRRLGKVIDWKTRRDT